MLCAAHWSQHIYLAADLMRNELHTNAENHNNYRKKTYKCYTEMPLKKQDGYTLYIP